MSIRPDKDQTCALYARHATKDELRLDEQVLALENFCSERGWDRLIVYRDDGYSGSNLERPGFQRMVCDIEDHKIKSVVVTSIDRLSRSLPVTEKFFPCLSPNMCN